MKGNRIPKDESSVLALAESMARGLQAEGAGLGITGVSGPAMQALIVAYRAAQGAVQRAKQTKHEAKQALQAADAAATVFITNAKKALTFHLGDRWSMA